MIVTGQEPRLPQIARLSEATVQSAADASEQMRRIGQIVRSTQQLSAPPPVRHLRVHPKVWATALDLADGNAKRIRVVSATEVVVENG